MKEIVLSIVLLMVASCTTKSSNASKLLEKKREAPFTWNAANVYFLVTDRFSNGDAENDMAYSRVEKTGKLRGFEGGDLRGVIDKIEEGYFTKLGVNVLWMTPIVEQIHGAVNEGTGVTYGYHGYWTKDWTKIDPNFGNKEILHELVKVAHANGIKVMLDAVLNHTGPVTKQDPVWPKEWVRTIPQCTYDTYTNTVACTLVKNLPDVRTESNQEVELPEYLVEKWKTEGRYQKEVQELDAFFRETGHPRAPRFYIMKWLADYIKEFGIDGYRVDTVKHVEETVWQEFHSICQKAFDSYKKNHPEELYEKEFYLVGEVYGYGLSSGPIYNFSDKKVNYFDKAFQSLINFEFKWNAKQLPNYETLFATYANTLQTKLKGYSVLNYLSSHDDGQPFDPERKRGFEAATKLFLTPGMSQIYYGDELGRPLVINEAEGDANLRSNMPWNTISDSTTKTLLMHWQKLGSFRKNHPAVGAGKHTIISEAPYVFRRVYGKGDYKDSVVIGLDVPKGSKTIDVSSVFLDGTTVRDAYSEKEIKVVNGAVNLESIYTIVLLENVDKN